MNFDTYFFSVVVHLLSRKTGVQDTVKEVESNRQSHFFSFVHNTFSAIWCVSVEEEANKMNGFEKISQRYLPNFDVF